MNHKPNFYVFFPLRRVESFSTVAMVLYKGKGVDLYDYEIGSMPKEYRIFQQIEDRPCLVDCGGYVNGGINTIVNHLDRRYPVPPIFFGCSVPLTFKYQLTQIVRNRVDKLVSDYFFDDIVKFSVKLEAFLKRLELNYEFCFTDRDASRLDFTDLYLLGFLSFLDAYDYKLILSSVPKMASYFAFLKSHSVYGSLKECYERRHLFTRFPDSKDYDHEKWLKGFGLTEQQLELLGAI